MSLRDIKFEREYRSMHIDICKQFYIPALTEAISYKRSVGYFSSSALIEIALGIEKLVENCGHIQIIASPDLSDDDIQAINDGYDKRKEIIQSCLLREVNRQIELKPYEENCLNYLTHLIEMGILDIKIAVLSNNKGLGIFHEKMGLITDSQGNMVAFSGSMNETSAGMKSNYEAVDVYTSWTDDILRVIDKKNAFEKLWTNTEQHVEVFDFPNIKEAIVKKYRKSELNTKPYSLQKELEQYFSDKTMKYEMAGFRMPDNIALYDYQLDAIEKWAEYDFCGIFDMATGTGKTYTGLAATSKLLESLNGNLAVIIVVPYQHLVEQWVDDIRNFNVEPIIGYSSSPQKNWKNRLSKAVVDQKVRLDKKFFCFICTNATFTSSFVQEQISKIKSPILLLVDEAHNFGAKSYSKYLDDRFKYRLALSATLERHRDEEGTATLYNFFGKKCISYSLERAIKEDKLTPYKYYPVVVYLNEDELLHYDQLSYEMSKHLIKDKKGNTKLDKYGELLAIKRSRIVAAASLKLSKLQEVIMPYTDDHFILVYCGATNILPSNADISETNVDDLKQIEAVTKILGNKLNMKVSKFTAEENIDERNAIKQHFKDGDDLQAIVAIKCLDEGVNIPGIKTAFILASSTNPKEYIQRRGRVLRKSPQTGKTFAEIYDFITLPRPLDEVSGLTKEQISREMSLVKNELKRIIEFGRISLNPMDAQKLIWEICDCYNLPYEFEEEEDSYEYSEF